MVIEDDGPGFAPEIYERIGEPYVTSRPGHHALGETEMGPQGSLDEHEGMGLGFFIAKILLEQTGGVVKAVNPPGGGARVSIVWARGVIDGPEPPASRRRIKDRLTHPAAGTMSPAMNPRKRPS